MPNDPILQALTLKKISVELIPEANYGLDPDGFPNHIPARLRFRAQLPGVKMTIHNEFLTPEELQGALSA